MSASGKRIGFVLLSNPDQPAPSTRISVLNMLPWLRESGYDPVIAYHPETAKEMPDITGVAREMQGLGIDIAYFQKVHGPTVRTEVGLLRDAGIQTVYGVCDRIDDEMAHAADATVVVTEFLKRQYAVELQERIHVVHDGIEHPEICCDNSTISGSSRRLRATLVTSSHLESIPVLGSLPRYLDLTVVGLYPERTTPWLEARTRLRRALRGPGGPTFRPLLGFGFRTRAWHPRRVYADLLQADVGIIPVDMRFDPIPGRQVSWWEVKSENRLTLKMALGLPVVASPVPSYLDVIEQGVNGYIAHTRSEWLDALHALRDPRHRKDVGAAARESVLQRYSMERQARRLITVFDELRTRRDHRTTVAVRK